LGLSGCDHFQRSLLWFHDCALPGAGQALRNRLIPPAPHQQYLQAFDTFRGFAALLVAIGHCWWASYPVFARTQFTFGFLAYDAKAVPMFAVLSGFLIYRSVLTIKSLDDLRAYVVRRFFRIYPTYLLSVVLCVITAQYIAGENFSGRGFFSDLFMLKAFNRPGGQANPVTWSLYIEVAFYAFLPLFVLTLGRRRVVVASAVAIVAMIIAEYPSREFGLWKFFLMGILASELSWSEAFKHKAAGWLSLIVGMALLVYDFGGPDHDWMAHLGFNTLRWDYETLALGLGCCLVLASFPHVKAATKMLDVLPLRLLGVISYAFTSLTSSTFSPTFQSLSGLRMPERHRCTSISNHCRSWSGGICQLYFCLAVSHGHSSATYLSNAPGSG
jgi:peptidoglycan/LPS O-acetylase OafA/YrhL